MSLDGESRKVKNKINVDIILPSYNSYKYVETTIKSIIKQSFKNWRLIIVDSSSNIKTLKVLKKFKKNKKIKIFSFKKKLTAAQSRNLALKKIKAKYVAFIDSDDVWMPEKLEKQINFMEINNYEFSYTQYLPFSEHKNYRLVRPKDEYSYESFIGDTSISTSSMILKKDIIQKAKFTNTPICEDYFFKCLILKNCNAFCYPESLLKYRVRKDSLQSNKLRNFYWIWKINKDFNNFNFLSNLKSLLLISLSSLLKYGFK